jgi:L-rhamnose mutarotase
MKPEQNIVSLFDVLHSSFLRYELEFLIDIDYKNDSTSVFKILTYERMAKEFFPDFTGYDTFRTTELQKYGTEEYLKKHREYWDHFSDYMEQYKSQGIHSYDERQMMFYKTINEEIGKREPKDVCIAFSKEDLDIIEDKYINSNYLKEIERSFFDNNIMVLVVFSHTGVTFPKNWEFINSNGKYMFRVEIWDQEGMGVALLNETLFLIKIKK